MTSDKTNLSKYVMLGAVVFVSLLTIVSLTQQPPTPGPSAIQANEQAQEQAFLSSGLSTDTGKSLIDLDLVLSGGPPKDGIPAINIPTFTGISSASSNLADDTLGLLVTADDDERFYPYNILVWHEIVNDTVGGIPVSVTFCPLCGSGIVYERVVNGQEVLFGVSGRLYESNLLMYDSATESLWSQIEGRAVIGSLARAC